MAKSQRVKMPKVQPATKKIEYPLNAIQHAAQLARDFAQVYEHIEEFRSREMKTHEAFKDKVKKCVKKVVATGPKFSSKRDRSTFQDRVFDMIWDYSSLTVPQDMLDALDQSFRCLFPKIQALEFACRHSNWYPAHPTVCPRAEQVADTLLNTEVANFSGGYEVADSADGDSSDDVKEIGPGIQVKLAAIRLQGSLDLSPDQSDENADQETNQERREYSEVGYKPKYEDEAAAMVLPDPAVFTITLGIPMAAGDHRFSIKFNNERVVDGLNRMPSRETWQLVHDAIQQDPDIPDRSSSLPRVTEVHQQDHERLAFRLRTEEDVDTLSANVQWARNFRDAISAGIKTYKVVFEFVRIRTIKAEDQKGRASIINKLREENSGKIPSINHLGAIRDVMMIQDPASKSERDDCANYILVFGSREAANAALKLGLTFRKKNRACVVYEPGTQWHQQCSNCQGHSHAAKDCQSTPLCGKCGYKHLTHYCTSATVECANCHGEHVASSKKCPKWLQAEEKAHRSYRFPADEDSGTQIPTREIPTTAVTLLPPTSLRPGDQPSRPDNTRNKNPNTLLPSPHPSQAASVKRRTSIKPEPNESSIRNDGPSALRQTNDDLQPFVAARTNAPNLGKRRAPEDAIMMTGALPVIKAEPDEKSLIRNDATLPQNPANNSNLSSAARANAPNRGKRRAPEDAVMMTGALPADDYDEREGKRMKREDEGPVWPIGQGNYQPPSLRLRGW